MNALVWLEGRWNAIHSRMNEENPGLAPSDKLRRKPGR
jgi:hypothetical protein